MTSQDRIEFKKSPVPAEPNDTISIVHTARIAGLLYGAIIVCGIFSEAVVRGQLVDLTDAASTSRSILDARLLFKSGFVADTIMLLCDVAVAILLYRLLRCVNATLSLMAAAFRLIQTAILAVNLLNHHAPLLLLENSAYATHFSGNQRDALILFFLDLHGHAYDLGLVFFAVSNLILGYLVAKSHFLPTVLGYALQLAGVVYLAGSYCRFLLPDYLAALQPAYIIPLVAEVSFCLWLSIKGVKQAAD
ncbi:conserved membrane hypothetical protein [Desulfosarcina cetonica]|uniref:DUF4386 domain-containing protein n=1 Tax=Desulfosarcina cetonica TaxID=90730 RepID=UPI0006D2682D|nr:DUF4386 domain-containing protein [Desulfosarcina cetonica]VTR67341.1 conserved membrane hypothetical protein [Desulfosarcina cetonica]